MISASSQAIKIVPIEAPAAPQSRTSLRSLPFAIPPAEIIGMLQLFYGIRSSGEFTPASIAGGIYTKMITSAAGLIIGLLAYVAYNFLSSQINKVVNKMEVASAEFIDILQEPTK